jgi:hypothetical protein
MCTDPEAVRGSRVVPQVFPRITKFAYRVTTQTEFDETLNQLFGTGADNSSIDQLLADMDSPLEGESGRRHLARIRGGRQRAGQVRQQGHHRRLQPEGVGHPHRAHAGQGQDRHPLSH